MGREDRKNKVEVGIDEVHTDREGKDDGLEEEHFDPAANATLLASSRPKADITFGAQGKVSSFLV